MNMVEDLDNMFTSVNEQVGTIAGQVGQTPQGWNAGIFNLIQNLSQTVIVPIAGLIITFVLCYELITMVTQKNNFHELQKLLIRMSIGIMLRWEKIRYRK